MDRDLWTLLAGYLLLVNLAGFLLMGLDKRRARRGAWRISEKALFLPAVLLGLAAGAQNFWVFCKERLDRSKKEKNHRVGFNSHQ